jgi:hypothetical protein
LLRPAASAQPPLQYCISHSVMGSEHGCWWFIKAPVSVCAGWKWEVCLFHPILVDSNRTHPLFHGPPLGMPSTFQAPFSTAMPPLLSGRGVAVHQSNSLGSSLEPRMHGRIGETLLSAVRASQPQYSRQRLAHVFVFFCFCLSHSLPLREEE